ncbi:MAG: UDP binding domain-containing protein, partial [Atribacterota bacterium]
EINDFMPNFVLSMTREMVEGISKPQITIFGVAYKGNVDDTRETPAMKIIKLAENEGIEIKCYDPHVEEFEYELYSLEKAVKDSDCIVVVTDHKDFSKVKPESIKNKMRTKNILDTRNIIEEDRWKRAGFKVKTLGKVN